MIIVQGVVSLQALKTSNGLYKVVDNKKRRRRKISEKQTPKRKREEMAW